MMLKKIDTAFCEALSSQAVQQPRKRSHHNFHPSLDDAVSRLCIALARDSYVRPHIHRDLNQWELIIPLQGCARFLCFDDNGVVIETVTLSPLEAARGIECPANVWHTLVPVDKSVVILEVKPGPYQPTPEKDFADWSPLVEESSVDKFMCWARSASIGDDWKGR